MFNEINTFNLRFFSRFCSVFARGKFCLRRLCLCLRRLILSSTYNTSGLPELPSISHILLVEPPRKTILDTASDDFVEETDDFMENVRRKVRPHRYPCQSDAQY